MQAADFGRGKKRFWSGAQPAPSLYAQTTVVPGTVELHGNLKWRPERGRGELSNAVRLAIRDRLEVFIRSLLRSLIEIGPIYRTIPGVLLRK